MEANTRKLAQERVKKIKLASGKFINVEKNRVVRGLKIPKSEINLKTNTVNSYFITSDDKNNFHCPCRDFKNVGDIVICTHIVAYIIKKDPDERIAFKKVS